MTKQQAMEIMGIKEISDAWLALMDGVMDEWAARIEKICDAKRLEDIMEEYQVLSSCREDILKAAEEVRENKALSILTCLIDKALDNPDTYKAEETDFPLRRFGETRCNM